MPADPDFALFLLLEASFPWARLPCPDSQSSALGCLLPPGRRSSRGRRRVQRAPGWGTPLFAPASGVVSPCPATHCPSSPPQEDSISPKRNSQRDSSTRPHLTSPSGHPHLPASFTPSTLSHTELFILFQMQCSGHITKLLYFLFPLLATSFSFLLPDASLPILKNAAQRSPFWLLQPRVSRSLFWDPKHPVVFISEYWSHSRVIIH